MLVYGDDTRLTGSTSQYAGQRLAAEHAGRRRAPQVLGRRQAVGPAARAWLEFRFKDRTTGFFYFLYKSRTISIQFAHA